MNLVWIIEDDTMYAQMLKHQIEKSGEFTAEVFSEAEKIMTGNRELPKAVFLDYQLPGNNGGSVLDFFQQCDKDLPVIVISGQENPTVSASLIKKGAYDYLTKTADTPRLLATILAKLSRQIRMKTELEILRTQLSKKNDFSQVMGTSTSVAKILPLFEKASRSSIIVSLSGNTGVGKETLAKTIHYNSTRAALPFHTLRMGSIPTDSFEKTFFGETDNDNTPGILKQVDGGTLFLDEISEIDMYNQAKLFKILQDGKYTPLGSTEEKTITCRWIVSSNKNMKELVRKGDFREDLYYKLVGLPIHIPSLKDRRSDILLFARKFSNAFSRANGLNIFKFEKSAQEKLLNYNWPGNIRELKAVIELACVLADGDIITDNDIRYEETSPSQDLLSTEKSLREYSSYIIEYFLEKYEGDIPKVAQVLEIGKSTIYRMIKNKEIKQLIK